MPGSFRPPIRTCPNTCRSTGRAGAGCRASRARWARWWSRLPRPTCGPTAATGSRPRRSWPAPALSCRSWAGGARTWKPWPRPGPRGRGGCGARHAVACGQAPAGAGLRGQGHPAAGRWRPAGRHLDGAPRAAGRAGGGACGGIRVGICRREAGPRARRHAGKGRGPSPDLVAGRHRLAHQSAWQRCLLQPGLPGAPAHWGVQRHAVRGRLASDGTCA